MRAAVAFLLLCACAWTAEGPAQVLFDNARARVLANLAKVPRYTCVETIKRMQHHPQYGFSGGRCSALIAARGNAKSIGLILWRDRLRVDVAVVDGAEMFSWAGASRFETNDIEKLAMSGSSGSGAFSSFLAGIFGNDPDHFVYQGTEDRLSVYEYTVPQQRSHYVYRMNTGVDRVIGYRGRFYVEPATAEVRRLIVEATGFPEGEACRVEDRMDYRTVNIGAGEFMLPELSTMTVLYANGDESINETRFSGCHEYVGESTIRFDGDDEPAAASAAAAAKVALKALPHGVHVRVHPESPLDSDVAAAGDAVSAVVEREVRDKGEVVIRKSDRLHGRVLRFEQYLAPYPRWVVAIRFDSIERDGVIQPVTFRPVSDGLVRPALRYGVLRTPPLPKEPKGAGIYGFDTPGKLLLDESFHSDWEVSR